MNHPYWWLIGPDGHKYKHSCSREELEEHLRRGMFVDRYNGHGPVCVNLPDGCRIEQDPDGYEDYEAEDFWEGGEGA